jgi:hypothetical protein
MVEEAYARYGLSANRAGAYLATFRAVAGKYPEKDAGEIFTDLVETTPGEEGKWFAAGVEQACSTKRCRWPGRPPATPAPWRARPGITSTTTPPLP